MDSREKAVLLMAQAESIVATAREVMDEKKHYDLSGELLAIDTILCNILRSQRQGY